MSEIDDIEKSLAKVKRASKALSTIFNCLFWATFVVSCFVIALLIFGEARQGLSTHLVSTMLFSVKILFEILLALLMIRILHCSFRDIAQGVSPFSAKQALRLRIAAALQVVQSIAMAIFSPAFLTVVGLDNSLGLASRSTLNASSMNFIPINAGDIVLAIVLFCAALIVEYGSLLQKLSDDTL